VNKAQEDAGKVVSIRRYPVKSMLGEELNSSYVTERGLVGDRAYALIDKETGKVASTKNPRKICNALYDLSISLDEKRHSFDNPSFRVIEDAYC
jgi:uncharacterized protein YcbX